MSKLGRQSQSLIRSGAPIAGVDHRVFDAGAHLDQPPDQRAALLNIRLEIDRSPKFISTAMSGPDRAQGASIPVLPARRAPCELQRFEGDGLWWISQSFFLKST
jgi:hypothetical protein